MEVLGDNFGTILVIKWGKDALRETLEGSRVDFLRTFVDFGSPLESILDNFLILYVIWTRRTWISDMFFDDFLMENVQFSDVQTLQKHCKYNGFHDISLFQLFHGIGVPGVVLSDILVSFSDLGDTFSDF